MPNSLNIPDDEFLKIVNEFNSFRSYKKKVEYIYKVFGKVYGEDKGEINGQTLHISLKPTNQAEEIYRWNYLFNKKSDEYYDKWYNEIKVKFQIAEDKMEFIKIRLSKVRDSVKTQNRPGYEKDKMMNQLHEIIDLEKAIPKIIAPQIQEFAKGHALYRLEKYLLKLLENEAYEDSLSDLQLDFKEYKLVLLYRLGIIDYLLNNIEGFKNIIPTGRGEEQITYDTAKCARLVASIIGVEDRKGIDNLKKYVYRLKNVSPSDNSFPANKTALNQVDGELKKLGIELPEIVKRKKKG